MNFSFEGNFKQRRNINLGGAKSRQDKNSLLAKAQSERKARELERLRKSSTIKIQSFYRGRREAQRVRDQCRQLLIQQLPALLKDPSANSVVQCSRYLLLLYQTPLQSDAALACQFCQCLIAPARDDMPLLALPWSGQSSVAQDAWTWLLQLLTKRTFLPLLQSQSDSIQPAPIMRCLLLLLEPSTYQTLAKDTAVETHARIVTYCVLKVQLLHVLRLLFGRLAGLETGLLTDATRILAKVMQFNPPPPLHHPASNATTSPQELTRPVIVDLFVIHVFSMPFLLDALDRHTARQFLTTLPLHDILKSIKSEETREQVDGTDAVAGLLINIIQMERIQTIPPTAEVVENYIYVIQALLTDLAPIYFVKTRESSDTHNADSLDDDTSDDEAAAEPSKRDATTSAINPVIRERLDSLFDKEDIVRLMNRLLAAPLAPDRLATGIAQMFNTLLLHMPSKKDQIMNTLVFRRWPCRQQASQLHLTQILWNAWKHATFAHVFEQEEPLFQAKTQAIVLDQALTSQWSVLSLLCHIYTRLLITTGDDEFFSKTNEQFRPEVVIPLSRQLKNISFYFYWRAGAQGMEMPLDRTGLKAEQLCASVTEVLQRIHARDSRHSFCPKDHWLIKGLDTASFINEAVAEEFVLADKQPEEAKSSRLPPKSKLAIISPRLGVLNNIPFVIPFEHRVSIFRLFVANDRKRNPFDIPYLQPRNPVPIRRNHVFEDGFDRLSHLGARFKDRVPIVFVDEHGLEEAGIDGGGVFKEFITSLGQEAFNTDYGLFRSTPDQYLYPSSSMLALDPSKMLAFFEFLGLVIGKALYEGILLDVAFADFFLKACLGKVNYLDDLPSLDPELYKGLIQVKNFQGNVEDLSLDFTQTHNDLGESRTVELVRNGSQVPVTNENRIRYVHLVANYRLNVEIARQSKAFFRGLSTIVDIKWLRMFNQQELQILLGGVLTPINVDDLQQNTVYQGYSEQDDTVVFFWQALRSFDNEHRMKFVKFVTSCARPPLLGFKELQPRFAIRRAEGDTTRLPTSSTCVNQLKLPPFATYDRLREKLLYAITADAGFDLS